MRNRWGCAHGGPLAHAVIRHTADDFAVIEQLGFEPDGCGEHDFLFIEKRETNTAWLARQLAAFAGIAARDVGYSGLKDRHAVTCQWFSVRRPGGPTADWQTFDPDGVRILQVTRNSRKLRRGAHSSNHFSIVLRKLVTDRGQLNERLSILADIGVPNYFGEQRFGIEGRNIALATSLFAGKRLAREKRSIAISAARSLLFNDYLAVRVVGRTWNTLHDGDIAALDGSGSVFSVDAMDDDLERRCLQMDIHPSGPLWGKGTTETPEDEAYAVMAVDLGRHATASRRALRLPARNLKWNYADDVLELSFELSRGGYATSVLRELVDY